MSQAGFDLFGVAPAAPTRSPRPAPPAPAKAAAIVDLLPMRPRAWQEHVARAAAAPLLLEYCVYWTGQVLETLELPAETLWLMLDGKILTRAPSKIAPRRVVYVARALLQTIARGHPLVCLSRASKAGLYRLASPDEIARNAFSREPLAGIDPE